MSSYNKVILLGNLTRDPELRYTPSQTPVVEFGLATNRKWRGQDGTERDETCFVDCTMFGRRAEVISKFFSKGSPIFVEGRLTFDTWQAQDGSRRSKHRVTIENFEFVGGGGGAGSGGSSGGYGGPRGGRGRGGGGGPVEEPFPSNDYGPEPFGPGEDDIPF